MSLFHIFALLIILAAVLGWVNARFIGLPHAIAMLIMPLAGSLVLILGDIYIPGFAFINHLEEAIRSIDFFETLMTGMLSFLLFAGAQHVDLRKLRMHRTPIFLMASVGVVISTVIIGCGLYYVAQMMGIDLPLAWALVFGALISPTDPVAVLSILKTTDISKSLETKIAGESLFNDGSGVIAFTVLLTVALATTGGPVDPESHIIDATGTVNALAVTWTFLWEVVGAVIVGVIGGFGTFLMLRSIDDETVETLLSIALVLGTAIFCSLLHFSVPIAVVVAGLVIGNWGVKAMSEKTKAHLKPFWTMIDEILNSVLFLLIGLEVLVIKFATANWGIMFAAIPIVLIARMISVAIPVHGLRFTGTTFNTGSIRIMTWGGVRGGISVALALSMPDTGYKDLLLSITYIVVCFSIIAQGLTIKPMVDRLTKHIHPAPAH
ncbi:sodium:proton antiporter [Rhizobium sp. MHM7A]|uniref:cation:proton antiporter n=1 Tax=Rhizobium sp. MHM7A TaxID=2583233 RepID=UPI001106745E|nr:sodium:proton antiporter [Rhizobium sp. MHM7A]TLX16798.1 sodium:proton antiporter [Rhizobium sp. MHM7A]